MKARLSHCIGVSILAIGMSSPVFAGSYPKDWPEQLPRQMPHQQLPDQVPHGLPRQMPIYTPGLPVYYSVTPFELAHLAYRGYFADYGFRSYQSFCSQWQWGQIDEEALASAAIWSGRLAIGFADDGYVNALDMQIDNLCRD